MIIKKSLLALLTLVLASMSIHCRAQSLQQQISSFLGYEVDIERIDTIPCNPPRLIDPCDVSILTPEFSSLDWCEGEIVEAPIFALKTNLLYDVATALNIEIEVPIGKRWSVAGEWVFPWWLSESRQRCFQVLMGNIEGRYWFGDRQHQAPLTGWVAGLYVGGGYYDLEWDRRGYQGEYLLSGGLSGGYAHPIGERLRLEYSLGVGLLLTKYRKYEAQRRDTGGWSLCRELSGRTGWFGPTRARISLVWMIGDKSKIGGKR